MSTTTSETAGHGRGLPRPQLDPRKQPVTDLVPLNSRHAAPTRPAPAPAMTLSETERVCNMIASGGDLVPACYRGKPGAVYLTLMWARKHNVDELTAIQNIVPINGKPFVQSELRRETIEAKGYAIEVVESTARRCEIEITAPNGKVRRVVSAPPDAPEETDDGLIFVQPGAEFGSNALWKTRRSDMLYALAIRIGDRRIVGSAAAGVDAGQDYTDLPPDPLAVLAQRAPDGDVVLVGDDEPTDAELVEDTAPADLAPPAVVIPSTADDLVSLATAAGLKPPKVGLLKTAQRLGHGVATIDDLVANQVAVEAVKADLADLAARKAAAQQGEG